MNIGPTADGRIIPIFEERLRDVGSWLKVNGDAIYATKPWTYQNDTKTPNVWYTTKAPADSTLRFRSGGQASAAATVYAIVLDWPADGVLMLGAPAATSQTTVSMLGVPGSLQWAKGAGGGISVKMPTLNPKNMTSACAWTVVLRGLA